MQVFSIRNEEKAHHFDPSIPSSSKEMLPHKTLCGYATSPIQERRTDESEHATWLSKGSKGPPNIHMSDTWPKERVIGAHKGSEPWVRPNYLSGAPSQPSTWWLAISPKWFSWGA
jgi:hypothetical protein